MPFDWNHSPLFDMPSVDEILVHDETLRDGIQNPSANDPTIEEKIEILHLLESVGVDSVNVGLPGAGPRPLRDTLRLTEEIVSQKLKIRPACAGRTLVQDLVAVADVSQKLGIAIEVMTFVGSSAIRQYVENWSVEFIKERSIEAIDFAVSEGLPVTYVTEDTTRSDPKMLDELFRAVIDHGAHRLCLCDTVGHATPDGAKNLVKFTRNLIRGLGTDTRIDWHGHNDRGFALWNALNALSAGADRIHGCVLGVGERVGNTSLEMLLLNLESLGLSGDRKLEAIPELCRVTARATGMPIDSLHPIYERLAEAAE